MSKLFNEMGDFNEIREEINNWTLKPINKDQASHMEIVQLSNSSGKATIMLWL